MFNLLSSITSKSKDLLDKPGVYRIYNRLTGQNYVGSSSKSLFYRLKRHYSDLQNNKHHSNKLQNSWNKYTPAVFLFEILDYCTEDILTIEQSYMDSLHPFFNINPVARNCSGRTFTDASKIKMSISAKKRGLNPSLLSNQKLKAVFDSCGKKICTKCSIFKDVEVFPKAGNVCKACRLSSQKSRAVPGKRTAYGDSQSIGIVIAYSETETLEFRSMRDAERNFKHAKVNKHNIKRCLNKDLIYHGFKWKLKNA